VTTGAGSRSTTRGARVLAGACALVLTLAACDDGASSADTPGSTSDADRPTAPEPVDEGMRTRATSADGRLTIETSSTRAGIVTNGDVLVTLTGDAVANAGDAVRVTAAGREVEGVRPVGGNTRRVLVTGLRDGENELVAEAGGSEVALAVTNHPKNGPVFAGPHLEPWVCTTERAGLGPATNDDCDAPTKTAWSYRTTDGELKPLDSPESRPGDLATARVGGRTVPFIVRAEQGVIDRGIYWIWVLDPDPGADQWDATGWNERLVYRFGGGCGTQYSQGSPLGVDVDADLLGRGYAIATNTLNTFQTACNDVLSAEAAAMTREHFVEQYGVPRFTIGDGGSGGAIQQLLIAHNYPGLLDALSPAVPFPDAVSISGGVTDCGLLVNYYASPRGAALTPEQRTAINGHATAGTCEMWNRLFVGGVDPTNGCDPTLEEQAYDRETKQGVRCTLQDSNVAIVGEDPSTGFARRPLDNTGVQYGWQALRDGVISVDQFLDLNEFVGGYDIDGTIMPQREVADEETVQIAYRTGRVIGPGPLADVPIILRNVYTDALGDIHTRVHPFSIRDRLRDGDEDDPNLLLWTTPPGEGGLVATLLGNIGDANAPIVVLDEWLTALDGTDADDPMPERLAVAKPEAAVNRCVLPDGRAVTGGWEIYDDDGPCRTAYPVRGDPRMAAGQERRGDVVKCALVPADPDSYGVELTGAQRERLARVFPDGVCDWSAPGVGVRPSDGPWQSFGP
jgi:hypothetical protein